ncbi:hypothetical protein OS493_004223 [Desmophyllum pertusum]|uniref:Uncharacterized protein n=1 Tax=Desmophyllum pertusum TaxID=174260 RepID=A0A9W9ZSU0_9CNID|nr:hypothetical protein OS493_004223 [Desmophyllum pertusum]
MIFVAKSTNLLDAKLLNNFIDCIQELYKIYQKGDWKTIRNIIPQEVRDLVRKIPTLGKNLSSIAKREELSFVSVYLLYRTFDLCDRVMNLDMDYKMYRNEFELLQKEIQPVLESIDNELLPLWEHLDGATLRKITQSLIKKLARKVYEDMKRSASGRRWAALYGVASTAVCVGSIFVGNVPGGIACAAGTALSGISLVSLTTTIKKLESLLHDMTILTNEIEECRTLLEQKPIYEGIAFGISGLTLFLSVVLWRLHQRNAQRAATGQQLCSN